MTSSSQMSPAHVEKTGAAGAVVLRNSSPVPAKPSGTIDSLFKTPRAGAAALPPRASAVSPIPETRDSAKYVQELRQQASDLEEILRNQSHPTDLAVVKQPRTPVFARPSSYRVTKNPWILNVKNGFWKITSAKHKLPAGGGGERSLKAIRSGPDGLPELVYATDSGTESVEPASDWTAVRRVRFLPLPPSPQGDR